MRDFDIELSMSGTNNEISTDKFNQIETELLGINPNEDISSFEKLKQVGIFKQFLNSEKADLDKFLPDFEKFLADRNLAVKSNLFEKEELFEIPLLDENFEFVMKNFPKYKEDLNTGHTNTGNI